MKTLLWTLALATGAAAADVPPRLASPLAPLPASWAGDGWQVDLLERGAAQWRQGGSDQLGGYALEGRRLELQPPEGPPLRLTLQPDGRLRTETGALLARRQPAAPFEPRLVLSGWFTYFADAPRIVLCADGRALPVQPAGDYLALERAYTAARPGPGAPLWVQLDARIAPRPSMEEGRPPVSTLVVERFERADPQGRCTGLRADRPLEGSEWRAFWMAGEAPAPSRAMLRLAGGRVAGSDGCNRLMGPVRQQGERLAFGPLAGTRMACPDDGGAAAAFGAALARVARHAVRGDVLELQDEAGAALLRLRAAD